MGFGTSAQLGNRQPGITQGTSLADIFRGNIGAPQPVGVTQRPMQLFELIQQLLGGAAPPSVGGTGQNATPLSAVTAQPTTGLPPPTVRGGPILSQPAGGTPLNRITNPVGGLINQRFVR